jgi:hypothetical protein
MHLTPGGRGREDTAGRISNNAFYLNLLARKLRDLSG